MFPRQASKGQTAFEFILLVAFVLGVTTLILSYYWQVEPSTKVLISTRQHVLQELSKVDGFFVIQTIIVSVQSDGYRVTIGFEPNIDCSKTQSSSDLTVFCTNLVGADDTAVDSAVEQVVSSEANAGKVQIQTVSFP